jgi:hypothetical protein
LGARTSTHVGPYTRVSAARQRQAIQALKGGNRT